MTDLLKHPELITGTQLLEAEKRMPERLSRLWRLLNKHCRGRRNAMKAADIGVRLGYLTTSKDGKSVGDGKKVVHMVSTLVREHLKPVGSVCSGDRSRRGLYVIVTREEKAIERARIKHRRIELTRREIAIDRAPIETCPPVQGEMF